MAIKRVAKKELKTSHTGGGTETSPYRPQWVEKTAPCSTGCPQGTDIRGIMTTIQKGEKLGKPREETFRQVFEMLAEKNPLPATCGRVCPHPCEAECNRREHDGSVAINNVERFVGDWALEQKIPLPGVETGKRTERVTVIGSGPAGLSCAYHLARRGYPVKIYEAFPKPGGMLRYGIPAYRLPREVLDAEIGRILDLGVKLQCDVMVGRDLTFDEVRKEAEVVFVGIGAHKGKKLGCPGEEADNVWTGTDFLNRVNRGETVAVGQKVLVVGGGDTAIDAARVARRMGADVTIVYRRTRNEMPAIDEEIVGAEEEGVEFHFLAAPLDLPVSNGRATAMRCQQMELGEPDASGRRRPVPVEGDVFTLPADTVIAAISQEPEFEGLEGLREGRDWIKVDAGGETKVEGVYAGGDALDLGLVTVALYQGRLAADTIHRKLRGIPEEKSDPADPVIHADRMVLGYYEKKLRHECDHMSAGDRLAAPEAEITNTLSEAATVEEALRCMSCGSCFDCGTCWSYCQDSAIVKPLEKGDRYKFKMEFCKGCKKCAEQCPCGFIEMVDPGTGQIVDLRAN